MSSQGDLHPFFFSTWLPYSVFFLTQNIISALDTDDILDGQSLQSAAFGCQLRQNLLPSEEHQLPS